MNERIKQISQEVWEWSDSQEYKGVDEFSEIWEAEFARRIIQECAGVISDRIGPKSALDILEHFGVNESAQRDENIRNRSTYFGNE